MIANEYISEITIRFEKVQDWINVITLLYEKTLKQSMVHTERDEKEALALKKIYNHYLDGRKEIMKNTQFKVEDLFGDAINKDNFCLDHIIKLNKLLAKMM